MLEPWNNAAFASPPLLTAKILRLFDADRLQYICNEIINLLSKQSPLHKESAIVSRLIYKYDKKFRNDIGYRNLRKVNTALHRYLSLNLGKDVKTFVSMMPISNGDDCYFPTRQMLEYLLVRLQTFSKIMLRICVTSKQTAVFYLDRIKRGESHWMSLMPYSALSRLWSLSSILIYHSCHWYNSLYPFLIHLQPKGLAILPENYYMPCNLGDWLDVKNIEDMGRFEWAENKSTEVLPSLTGIEDPDESFDIFKYVSEINDEKLDNHGDFQKLSEQKISDFSCDPVRPVGNNLINIIESSKLSQDSESKVLLNKTDIGERISRKQIDQSKNSENDKKPNNKPTIVKPDVTNKNQDILQNSAKKTIRKKEILHDPETVTSIETLRKFIKHEEKLRNEQSEFSLTNHISFMQWHSLKASLLKLCDPLSKNRKIQRKFQKIWQEKCVGCKE